jgi:AraC-like DNA-binding protein
MARSEDHIYLQTVPRPIAAMAKHYPAHYAGYRHTHTRAQLLYAGSGTMRFTIDAGCWIIPPRRAVWIPPDYPHQTGSLGPLEMKTLYIEREAVPACAPKVPRMLPVSTLLHELICRATIMPIEYEIDGQDGLILTTLLGEIDWKAIHPLSLPILHDPRLIQIERQIVRSPSKRKTLAVWARTCSVSPSTLTRLIQHETGLSFAEWRDRVLAFIAIPMLAKGHLLTEIADALGYDTAWSFTAMFKRVTGKVPSRFMDPA